VHAKPDPPVSSSCFSQRTERLLSSLGVVLVDTHHLAPLAGAQDLERVMDIVPYLQSDPVILNIGSFHLSSMEFLGDDDIAPEGVRSHGLANTSRVLDFLIQAIHT